ncbi:MAG TPA: hypothetical protein VG676_05500 [Chitinophagaceae bacterium]|jgi:hypothetical protein|nr:hypothetical protein [Chitinophagaceae bacterium]
MKKPVNKNNLENFTVAVSAFLQEPGVLQNLVEKLARRDEESVIADSLTGEWQPIATSSLEGYALGDLVLKDAKELINSPFDTCFVFTCTRESNSKYSMTWVCSLS